MNQLKSGNMKLIEILRKAQDREKATTDIFDADVDIKIVNGKKYIEFDYDGSQRIVELGDVE